MPAAAEGDPAPAPGLRCLVVVSGRGGVVVRGASGERTDGGERGGTADQYRLRRACYRPTVVSPHRSLDLPLTALREVTLSWMAADIDPGSAVVPVPPATSVESVCAAAPSQDVCVWSTDDAVVAAVSGQGVGAAGR